MTSIDIVAQEVLATREQITLLMTIFVRPPMREISMSRSRQGKNT
jgi:hypothetical protein